MLVAQYWGKRDTKAIEKIMGIAILFTEIVAVLFMVLSLFFPEQIMSVYIQ